MEELLKLAEAGDTDAMYQLGRAYQFAKFDDAPDYEKSIFLVQQSRSATAYRGYDFRRRCAFPWPRMQTRPRNGSRLVSGSL